MFGQSIRKRRNNACISWPEWISAEGAIGVRTPALLKAALTTLGGRKLPIVEKLLGKRQTVLHRPFARHKALDGEERELMPARLIRH